jgi:hypothetical protein
MQVGCGYVREREGESPWVRVRWCYKSQGGQLYTVRPPTKGEGVGLAGDEPASGRGR